MGDADRVAQVARRLAGLRLREPVDFRLQVLRREFPGHHRLAEEGLRDHAMAQCRRQGPGAHHHALGTVGRQCMILGIGRARRGGVHGFLDVDQAHLGAPALADAQEHGIAQAPQRAAALHPI